VGEERSDHAKKRKLSKAVGWTLADKPGGKAERNIRDAVMRLRDWLRDLPEVQINRNGSELII